MAKTKLDIKTADGVADAFAFHPDGKGPWPGIVFFFDAFGLRASMHQMAERLASKGYYVLLPNLYYRAGDFPPFDEKTAFSDPVERGRIMGMMGSLDAATIVEDAGAYLDALAKQPEVRGERFGAVGYCMGGRLAFTVAGHHAGRIAAIACVHGGHLVNDKPDSPHKLAPQVKASVYLGVADNDQSCPPEGQRELALALGAAHVHYQMELNPGARHGYAVPDSAAYDEVAAERHWARLTTLFGEAFARS